MLPTAALKRWLLSMLLLLPSTAGHPHELDLEPRDTQASTLAETESLPIEVFPSKGTCALAGDENLNISRYHAVSDYLTFFNHDENFHPRHPEFLNQPRGVVVTCMDARLSPEKSLGVPTGSLHVLRNAGGRVKNMLPSIIVSQLVFGTRDVTIIHHTKCGMVTPREDLEEALHEQVKHRLGRDETDKLFKELDFHPISSLEESLKEDVKTVQDHPLLEKSIVHGFIWNVTDDRIYQVV